MQRKSGFFSVKGMKQCPVETAAYLDVYKQIEEYIEMMKEKKEKEKEMLRMKEVEMLSVKEVEKLNGKEAEVLSGKSDFAFGERDHTSMFGSSILSSISENSGIGSKEEFSAW